MVNRIALVGFGLEGRANYEYLRQLYPDAKITIYDEKISENADLPSDVKLVSGQSDFTQISADLILRTPGIAPHRFAPDAPLTTGTNLFFEHCPAKIIGVTGTKGKGTTSSLLTSILRSAGHKVHLLGNIGRPALEQILEIKPNDIVVYEMSSFQLWDARFSPQVAVILMIEPDHLDMHKDMAEYVSAKSNITRHQQADDIVVYHASNSLSAQIAEQSPARQKLTYGDKNGAGVYVEADNFCVQGEVICPVAKMQILGKHNQENACASITTALQLGVDYESVAKGLADFTGLPHRLKFLAEIDGVAFFDDNYSTQPSATIVALKALADRPKILIAGGHDKGVDLAELAQAIKSDVLVKKVLLIGATAPKIKSALEALAYEDAEIVEFSSLFDLVKQAKSLAEPGDAVLMSPACASFGLFSNANDRGEQFVRAVRQLEAEK